MTQSDNFAERYANFKLDADAEVAATFSKIFPLLEQAQSHIEELAKKGIVLRVDLPPGVTAKITDLRCVGDFRFPIGGSVRSVKS